MLQTVSALLSKQEELNDALEQIKEHNWMVSSWDVCSMFGHMQNHNLKVRLHTVLTWAWCLKCKERIDPWELWKLLQCGMQTFCQRKIFQSFFIDFYILIISKSTESFSFCLFE
jgi:hypothetical protein